MTDEWSPWRRLPDFDGRLVEGPMWIPAASQFQWVDILGATLFRWNPYKECAVERRPLDLEFTTVALPLDGDRSIVASRNSIHEYRWSDSTLRQLGEWEFAPDVRFNDGAISPDGHIYVGTMSMERRIAAGHLYRFDGGLTPVLDGVGISNGLAWSPLTGRAFYVDSLSHQIDWLDLNCSPPRRGDFCLLGHDDEPDGIAVDSDGTVFVALWQGARLARLSPEGLRLSDVAVPAQSPTSVAFGGHRSEFNLVTTAASDVGGPETGGILWRRRCAI